MSAATPADGPVAQQAGYGLAWADLAGARFLVNEVETDDALKPNWPVWNRPSCWCRTRRTGRSSCASAPGCAAAHRGCSTPTAPPAAGVFQAA